MTMLGNYSLDGKSGTRYRFAAYSRDSEFDAFAAVYVMVRQDDLGHHLVYIGETADLSDRPLNCGCKDCFDHWGANAVWIYALPNLRKRQEIKADLRSRYHPRCNAEPSGALSAQAIAASFAMNEHRAVFLQTE